MPASGYDMDRLSSAVLTRAHRFLLEIHAAGDVDTLREVIPRGLSGLISSERASFNEIDVRAQSKRIVPTPVPTWWRRLGEVYSRHLMDHPLWSQAPLLNHVRSFDDSSYADTWRKS